MMLKICSDPNSVGIPVIFLPACNKHNLFFGIHSMAAKHGPYSQLKRGKKIQNKRKGEGRFFLFHYRSDEGSAGRNGLQLLAAGLSDLS